MLNTVVCGPDWNAQQFFLFSYLNLKLGPTTWVTAGGYSVLEMDNAADH